MRRGQLFSILIYLFGSSVLYFGGSASQCFGYLEFVFPVCYPSSGDLAFCPFGLGLFHFYLAGGSLLLCGVDVLLARDVSFCFLVRGDGITCILTQVGVCN